MGFLRLSDNKFETVFDQETKPDDLYLDNELRVFENLEAHPISNISQDRFEELIEATDDTLVKKRKHEPRNHGKKGNSLNEATVKGELAEYAYPMSLEEKKRVVERFAGVWEPFFFHPVYGMSDPANGFDDFGVPRHPWMKLKDVRDGRLSGYGFSKAERYALRFVKTFYGEMWRDLKD